MENSFKKISINSLEEKIGEEVGIFSFINSWKRRSYLLRTIDYSLNGDLSLISDYRNDKHTKINHGMLMIIFDKKQSKYGRIYMVVDDSD